MLTVTFAFEKITSHNVNIINFDMFMVNMTQNVFYKQGGYTQNKKEETCSPNK